MDEEYRKNQIESITKAMNRPEVIDKLSRGTSIAMKQLWSELWFQELMQKAHKIKPNKPEKFLIEFFKKLKINMEYVGNKKFWLTNIKTKNNFNSDFVNTKLKKIIEFYGSYWHNINTAKRDMDSINTFKYYGYQTLRLFYRDLKDINRLKEKVLKFYNKPNILKIHSK